MASLQSSRSRATEAWRSSFFLARSPNKFSRSPCSARINSRHSKMVCSSSRTCEGWPESGSNDETEALTWRYPSCRRSDSSEIKRVSRSISEPRACASSSERRASSAARCRTVSPRTCRSLASTSNARCNSPNCRACSPAPCLCICSASWYLLPIVKCALPTSVFTSWREACKSFTEFANPCICMSRPSLSLPVKLSACCRDKRRASSANFRCPSSAAKASLISDTSFLILALASSRAADSAASAAWMPSRSLLNKPWTWSNAWRSFSCTSPVRSSTFFCRASRAARSWTSCSCRALTLLCSWASAACRAACSCSTARPHFCMSAFCSDPSCFAAASWSARKPHCKCRIWSTRRPKSCSTPSVNRTTNGSPRPT
mmetsp:Transcript_92584/g.283531  ORF Transcript_92584/g.283531 Transcript_92584/m.283531 type:complete len:374 (-) Transcript_92584:183-1304(-)